MRQVFNIGDWVRVRTRGNGVFQVLAVDRNLGGDLLEIEQGPGMRWVFDHECRLLAEIPEEARADSCGALKR
jgi:hypothetical protein